MTNESPVDGLTIDRFHFRHLAGVIVVGPAGAHVGIPDDADTALVRWVTTVAGYVRDGFGLDDAQHFARQQLLPPDGLVRDDGATRCATITAGMFGVPVEITRKRLADTGLECCPIPYTGPDCVPAIHDRSDLRIVLIHG